MSTGFELDIHSKGRAVLWVRLDAETEDLPSDGVMDALLRSVPNVRLATVVEARGRPMGFARLVGGAGEISIGCGDSSSGVRRD